MNSNPTRDALLALLRVHSTVGGLEIADSAVRFARKTDGIWEFKSMRLPPGVVVNGRVKDKAQFTAALKALKQEIAPGRKKVNAVMSLSSINIYTQVFSLPVIEGENLERAIQLNIQMVSPAASSETYSGWQLVGEDKKSVRLEILSSFIDKSLVDDINEGLKEAGFVAYSIESRSLSLTRLVREVGSGFDKTKPYVVLSLDNTGLEFLIVRQGQLYFQYFNSWQDLQGDEREISEVAFEAVIIRNLHQVVNFYTSHWSEPLTELLLSTGSLKDELTKIITENFSLEVKEMTLTLSQEVDPEWFVALGSGLRSLVPRRDDRDISLLGITAQEDYRRHQVQNFLGFWRVLIPLALLALILIVSLADLFVMRTNQALQAGRVVGALESTEVAALKNQASDFNRSLTLIRGILNAAQHKSGVLDRVKGVFEANGLTLKRFSIEGPGSLVVVSGEAKSEDEISSFKRILNQDPQFQSVTLPLSEIRPVPGGVSFVMNFTIAPKTP